MAAMLMKATPRKSRRVSRSDSVMATTAAQAMKAASAVPETTQKWKVGCCQTASLPGLASMMAKKTIGAASKTPQNAHQRLVRLIDATSKRIGCTLIVGSD